VNDRKLPSPTSAGRRRRVAPRSTTPNKILAAMGVAQRCQTMLIDHSFGMPYLAK
jgi:hypothetical protein